ncbi:MAG: type IV pilus twitching motility protein PilT [Chloroflexi bacterium]|nr:type IV pilus twitching motility protein PilT [Chloroflexota bacterium]
MPGLEDISINDILRRMVEMKASDVHLKANSHIVYRIHGKLIPQMDLPVISEDWLEKGLEFMTLPEQRVAFRQNLELDFAYSIPGFARFRVNVALQRGTTTMVFRQINWQIPALEGLGLPEVCKTLVMRPRGLVLVTGPTGSGKSTTLAAMIDYLNAREARRIVTVEDPIEYLFRDKQCVITQREVGSDTRTFAQALKHVLRQDPDVILVGEMRDLETIGAALTAAETGHLVFATLHTPGAPQAIDRMIDVFPPHQQQQVRIQLSTTLEGVLYQTLIPKVGGGGRVPAVEVMIANGAIRNLIREGKTHQMMNVIQTSGALGMQGLDQVLAKLFRTKQISLESALEISSSPDELKRILAVQIS